MEYKIFPPIGIARVGNSDSVFFPAERPDSKGTELRGSTEVEVVSYKDAGYKMKRQAARFFVYEKDGEDWKPADLPDGAKVKWRVHVANRKDAIVRPLSPPSSPVMPTADPSRSERAIDSGTREVSVDNPGPVELSGTYLDHDVKLGEVHMNRKIELVFKPGKGISKSPEGADIGDSFYNNPGWYDDSCDGSVVATIEFEDGDEAECAPAWLVVAPPDFSPETKGVVTLYDIILQTAIDKGWATLPGRPSFETDIKPIIERASGLKKVDSQAIWSQISTDWATLADPSDAAKPQRRRVCTFLRAIASQDFLHDFSFQPWQLDFLQKYESGEFEQAARNEGKAWTYTRVILDATVGQGFYPGIEAGIIVRKPEIYLQPFDFRLDPAKVKPGDLTALMALPWQADFLKCAGGWWPAQRPNIAPQASGVADLHWVRPNALNTHSVFVDNVLKLGVIENTQGELVENGRDPSLDTL